MYGYAKHIEAQTVTKGRFFVHRSAFLALCVLYIQSKTIIQMGHQGCFWLLAGLYTFIRRVFVFRFSCLVDQGFCNARDALMLSILPSSLGDLPLYRSWLIV